VITNSTQLVRTLRRARTFRRAQPPAARTAAAIAAAAVIAACGSGSSHSPGSSSSTGSSSASGHATAVQIQNQLQHELVRFASCMRAHGVSNFPDPTSPGADKEFLLGQVPGIDEHSPAFESAQPACKHLLPGGGTVSRSATAQVMAQLLHVSQCLRTHGLTGFPDPTASAPSNENAYGDVIGFSAPHAPPGAPPAAYLAVPTSINPNSPAAEHAASACHFRL
jgi:hypothetical protein